MRCYFKGLFQRPTPQYFYGFLFILQDARFLENSRGDFASLPKPFQLLQVHFFILNAEYVGEAAKHGKGFHHGQLTTSKAAAYAATATGFLSLHPTTGVVPTAATVASAYASAVTMGTDLLPTFMDLAGITPAKNRKLDGTSLRDLLLYGKRLPKRQVFFGYEPKLGTAMRDGNWKMIVKANKVELYDLGKDIAEKTNVVDQNPDRAESMKAAIDNWKKDVAWSPK